MPASRWPGLERDDAAVADATRQPPHQRGGLTGKEQHAPADDGIKVAIQLNRARITDDERHLLKSRGRGPGPGRLDQLRVDIDPDDDPVPADQTGHQQRHVAGPGPDVENLHPARDARVLHEPRGVRREHSRLKPQPLSLPGGLTKQVIRCSPAHRGRLMTRPDPPAGRRGATSPDSTQAASRPAQRPRVPGRELPGRHPESVAEPLASAMTVGSFTAPCRRDGASLPSQRRARRRDRPCTPDASARNDHSRGAQRSVVFGGHAHHADRLARPS